MSIRACVLTCTSLGCSKTTIIPPFSFLPLFALPGYLNWPLKGYFEDIFGKKSCIKMWSTIGFLPLGEFPQQNGFVLEHFLQIHSYPQVSVHCLKPLQFTSVLLSVTRALIFPPGTQLSRHFLWVLGGPCVFQLRGADVAALGGSPLSLIPHYVGLFLLLHQLMIQGRDTLGCLQLFWGLLWRHSAWATRMLPNTLDLWTQKGC